MYWRSFSAIYLSRINLTLGNQTSRNLEFVILTRQAENRSNSVLSNVKYIAYYISNATRTQNRRFWVPFSATASQKGLRVGDPKAWYLKSKGLCEEEGKKNLLHQTWINSKWLGVGTPEGESQTEGKKNARTIKASPRIVEAQHNNSTCAAFQDSADKRGIFLLYLPANRYCKYFQNECDIQVATHSAANVHDVLQRCCTATTQVTVLVRCIYHKGDKLKKTKQ